MKLMKIAVVYICAITVICIIGALTGYLAPDVHLFESPMFILVVAIFMVLQILCIVTSKFSMKRLGFYICHIGIVLVLVGVATGMLSAQKINFTIPIDSSKYFSTIAKTDGKPVELGFKISILNFQVERYDPSYDLYINDKISKTDISPNSKGVYDFDALGKISRNQLVNDSGFVDKFVLSDSAYILLKSQTDKKYTATMNILKDSTTLSKSLRVNAPVSFNGWKFYLMNYDRQKSEYIQLMAKNDPGNIIVILGIWMIIVGTVWMCFVPMFKKRGKK